MELKPLTPKYLHLLHGADYNPDQWLSCPDILKRDIELMKEAHINCVSLGIFSWAALEPREGEYKLDWMEEIIENLYQNGVTTILATPSGAKPLWMSEKYPEIRRVTQDLVRDESGERHNHCYTSPVYREKVRAIDEALAKRFSFHPGVILWHLSNEYGGRCWCPLCQAAFREWLKKKYGSLEELNHRWWTSFWSHTYTDWEQIHAPTPRGESHTHGLNLDWNRFCTEQVVDFMKLERDTVKAVNPDIPVTTNFMFQYTEYNYFKFKDELDVISWDSYPQWDGVHDEETASNHAFWHDMMRSLKKQPFLLMESTPSVTNWTPVSRLKRPGIHMAASMQALGHGANSVQYFQFRKGRGAMEKFHGAVVDHYGGSDTREFRDVQAVGLRLEEMDQAVYKSRVKAQTALVFDVENLWAVEDAAGPRNCGIHYMETVQEHYRALWRMGLPVDIVDEEYDLTGYKLVVAPMLYLLRAGFEQKLRNFVESGGVLIGTCHTGLVDENDLCLLGGWPGGGLREVFGLWNEAEDGLWDGETNSIAVKTGVSYEVRELCALIHAQGAQVLGTYGSDFYEGEPAFTVNSFGKGRAFYIGAKPEESFYQDFYCLLIKELKLKKAVEGELPQGVEACLRETPEEKLLFLQNFSGEEREVKLPKGYEDLFTGVAAGRALLEPFDSRVFRRSTK